MKKLVRSFLGVLALTIISTQPTISQEQPQGVTANQVSEVNLGKKINDLMKLIRKSYVNQDRVPSNEELLDMISEEIFKKIGDKHGAYMSPKFSKIFRERMNPGNYVGVGIQILPKPSRHNEQAITIVSFFKGSMLPVAGIKIGDDIVGAGDPGTELFAPSKEEEIPLLIDKIKGREGTDVVLRIKRHGRYHVVTVPRVRTRRNFVQLGTLDDNKILPIKITSFSENLFGELMHAMRDAGYLTGDFTNLEKIKLDTTKVSGVILDLRDNPGGALISAVRVADMFLDEKKIIVSVDALGEESDVSYVSTKFKIFDNIPVAIMINEHSASASELIAAAINAHNNTVVKIGRKTYGKGSVQQTMPMGNDGSVVKITIAEYYSAGNVKINNIGVFPHIKTKPQNYYGATELEKYANKTIIRSHMNRKYDHMLNVSYTVIESFLKGSYDFQIRGRKKAQEEAKKVKTEYNCEELGLRGCKPPVHDDPEEIDGGPWTFGY